MFNYYEKIFVLKNCFDSSILKVNICKGIPKIKYGAYTRNEFGERVASAELIYEYNENLGNLNGIEYISEVSPLAKNLLHKEIGDLVKFVSDAGIFFKYKLINIYEKNIYNEGNDSTSKYELENHKYNVGVKVICKNKIATIIKRKTDHKNDMIYIMFSDKMVIPLDLSIVINNNLIKIA